MKQNKYDENELFSAYKELPRSVKGLDGAGEWHLLKEMLENNPDARDELRRPMFLLISAAK